MSTIHANGTADALARLETLALLADSGLPLAAVRAQLAASVDAVVHVARRARRDPAGRGDRRGGRRRRARRRPRGRASCSPRPVGLRPVEAPRRAPRRPDARPLDADGSRADPRARRRRTARVRARCVAAARRGAVADRLRRLGRDRRAGASPPVRPRSRGRWRRRHRPEPEEAVELWVSPCSRSLSSLPRRSRRRCSSSALAGVVVAARSALSVRRAAARAAVRRGAARARSSRSRPSCAAAARCERGRTPRGRGVASSRPTSGGCTPAPARARLWATRSAGGPRSTTRPACARRPVRSPVAAPRADAQPTRSTAWPSSLRQRLDAAAEARALSSQARLSAVVVGAAPLGYLAFSSFVDRRAVGVLVGTGVGRVCLVVGLGLEALAALWIRRIVGGAERDDAGCSGSRGACSSRGRCVRRARLDVVRTRGASRDVGACSPPGVGRARHRPVPSVAARGSRARRGVARTCRCRSCGIDARGRRPPPGSCREESCSAASSRSWSTCSASRSPPGARRTSRSRSRPRWAPPRSSAVLARRAAVPARWACELRPPRSTTPAARRRGSARSPTRCSPLTGSARRSVRSSARLAAEERAASAPAGRGARPPCAGQAAVPARVPRAARVRAAHRGAGPRRRAARL